MGINPPEPTSTLEVGNLNASFMTLCLPWKYTIARKA